MFQLALHAQRGEFTALGCRRRPGIEPLWRREVSQLLAGVLVEAV